MFCCFGSCSRRPDFQKSISLRLALPNHFHVGSLIKFPFSCQCGEAIISLVIWYQRQLLHVLKSVKYHIFRSENFQQNLKYSVDIAGAPNDNFRKNICSEDDLRSRIFGTFVVNFLACLSLLGFSNI